MTTPLVNLTLDLTSNPKTSTQTVQSKGEIERIETDLIALNNAAGAIDTSGITTNADDISNIQTTVNNILAYLRVLDDALAGPKPSASAPIPADL